MTTHDWIIFVIGGLTMACVTLAIKIIRMIILWKKRKSMVAQIIEKVKSQGSFIDELGNEWTMMSGLKDYPPLGGDNDLHS